jgi:hypothetical protein
MMNTETTIEEDRNWSKTLDNWVIINITGRGMLIHNTNCPASIPGLLEMRQTARLSTRHKPQK